MRVRSVSAGLSTRVWAATAALVIAGTLSAGCDGSPPRKSAAASCPAAPGVSPSQVKFGVIYPTTGPNASAFGPYRDGIVARLGVANAAGGVYGRTVTYDWADDAGLVDGNLSAARRLVGSNGVFGVEELSPSSQGSAQWLDQQGVPVVGTSLDLAWTKHRNMFSYSNFVTASGSVSTWGDYAKIQGTRKAAILYSWGVDASRLLGDSFRQSMRAAGIRVDMIEASPTTADIPAILRKIRSNGDDMITGFVSPGLFFDVALNARTATPGIKILSTVGYDRSILDAGQKLAGMSVFVPYRPFERPVPAHQRFLAAMSEYALAQPSAAANEIALEGWIGADMMLRGLEAAGRCPTRGSFITGFRNVSSYDAGGLLAAPVNMKTIFGNLDLCYSFLKVSSTADRFLPVGSKPLCGRRLD